MNFPVTGKDVFLDETIHQIGIWEVPIRISKYVVTPLIFEIKTQEILDFIKSTEKLFADSLEPDFEAKQDAEFLQMDKEEKAEREEKKKKYAERQKRREERKEDHAKRKTRREGKKATTGEEVVESKNEFAVEEDEE
jgi:hypothetical protein